MSSPIRVLVPVDDTDSEALAIPLAYAKTIAQRANSRAEKIVLLTHTKQQLRSTSLVSHLGVQACKALAANKPVGLGEGLVLHHETLQTLRFGVGRAIVIAFYADEKMMDFVDGLSGLIGVIAVPWLKGGAGAWAARWTPHVHGEAAQHPAKILDDPVIESALKQLSLVTNLSHSALHPRDKQYADETLRILRTKGHSAPVASIKSWAIREGWKPGAAEDLARLAEKIFALKTKPSLSKFHDADGRYARWKAGSEEA
ncbi:MULTISPECIES: hypothetical protein [unclassified Novosphingobium]|uniref:hypothetical protein n=1 Tax=unclassified Novosphingobium TaxID=2644732 RepID=UPI00146DB188|nr:MULTISPECIES: hypothetical protein [unclassified Novosphingobium]NMN03884.1 hypothetical protein [Novosphingobium sp. SG919]NMN86126.1 hypothetical protein [Novosphingobium sp. SG916]